MLHNTAEAIEVVKILNAEVEDDWTYEVVEVNAERGLSHIKVYDEDGFFLGNLP